MTDICRCIRGQPYVYFCNVHNFPYKPTPDIVSFYIVWLCNNDVQHVDPKSVDKYLSGICNELEDFYDDVRAIRNHCMVWKTLRECRRLYSKPTKRKSPLSISDLALAVKHYRHRHNHDDLLFLALLLTGWFGLLRLAELCLPDVRKHQNLRKRTRHDLVKWYLQGYGFDLPQHKADPFFEGNKVLWLQADGSMPTRSWFMDRLKSLYNRHDIAGQSIRSGGATGLAEIGVPLHLIRASGRWASETFHIYIRKNPTFLTALLLQ
ncbi:hypothetical protein K435DRAFT_924491 [Dendrothele bispora CBS 962.96]|uniref:Tyr recombinase domain-containing protein n=1 Tax=Dendrothele bispora (strain CBS 962.96) TaxID=1314807 RepID=A0A4S8LAJ9_DENBC|nr:hypothetical protein K435DRAFT_924491 [Dendrothele bispora CBS 962.96]